MNLGLRGNGAVVTGASKGIGRAIALGLARREGANIRVAILITAGLLSRIQQEHVVKEDTIRPSGSTSNDIDCSP